MLKYCLTAIGIFVLSICAYAQVRPVDTTAHAQQELSMDTLSADDYEELFNDFESFLDSLLMPRSYLLVNLSMSRGYYNYKRTGTARIRTEAATTFSPSISYYHKKGLGITAAGYIIAADKRLNLYQYSLSPSYDYLENRAFATGISYTRYFSKDSLPFYVSPLQNEANAYFTYRKWWLRPSVSVNYAWGSRKDLEERLGFIQSLRIRRRILNFLQQYKEVNDLSVTASVLHDFYWLHVFSGRSNIRVTPQVIFSAGTQQYGFNQSMNNYSRDKLTRANLLSTARQFNLDNKKEFRPLSLGFSLRTEYAIGKFYVQPQLLLDYYFPADNDNLSSLFAINAGVYF